MSSATTGPMPGVAAMSSALAASSASTSRNRWARLAARHVADALDAEREQHDPERPLARGLRARRRGARRDLADPVELQQLLLGEPVEVGRGAARARPPAASRPASPPGRRRPSRRANALSSCQRRSGQSRFGQRVKTPALTVGVSQAGAARRRPLRRRAVGALGRVRRGRDDLRDHVAGAQDDDRRRRADVLAGEVLLVVQRRQLDGDAADVDGLEHARTGAGRRTCRRSSRPGAGRDRGGRRELPGDRPARVAPDDPEPALQLEVVDLDDDAVDLEVERAAALLPAPGSGATTSSSPSRRSTSSLTRKPCVAQPLQRAPSASRSAAPRSPRCRSTTSTAAARRRASGRAGGSSPRPSCAGS